MGNHIKGNKRNIFALKESSLMWNLYSIFSYDSPAIWHLLNKWQNILDCCRCPATHLNTDLNLTMVDQFSDDRAGSKTKISNTARSIHNLKGEHFFIQKNISIMLPYDLDFPTPHILSSHVVNQVENIENKRAGENKVPSLCTSSTIS